MLKRLVSGIKPTGQLHIGSYIGAITQFVEQQSEYNSFFFVADYHALTAQPKPEEMTESTLHVAAMLIASGVDPKNATLFVQSDVPEHAELAIIFNNFATIGQLNRMTQYKEKFNQYGQNIGLFDYPVLMTADVAIYDAAVVPVGDDQVQHLELAREIIRSFNKHVGKDIFVEPKPLLSHAPRIMALTDPTKKMSKSLEGTAIGLLDDEATIARTIKRAVTDSDPNAAIKSPALANLFNILKMVSPHETYLEFEKLHRHGKLQYSELKEQLIEDSIEFLRPIQKSYRSIRQDDEGLIKTLAEGGKTARKQAQAKLAEVKKALGLTS